MILTTKQAEMYNNGKLDKKTFIKLLDTIDFDKYLLRYCKPVFDYRCFNSRTWIFSKYGYTIELTYTLGQFESIKYKKVK